jgi:starch synthase
MRILYVCLDPGVALGEPKGAAIRVTDVLRALETEEHETAVLARGTEADYDWERPTFVVEWIKGPKWIRDPVRRRVVRELRASPRLRRAVREAITAFRPDVVYESYALFRLEGRRETARLGLPLILEVNAPLVEEAQRFRRLPLGRIAVRFEQRLWREADLIVVPSDHLAARVREIRQGGVVTVPHGVDADRFIPKGDRRALRQKLDLEESFVVGWAGRLREWHALDTVVDAVARLPTKLSAKLLVVGDGAESGQVEERAATLGVDTRFAGPVPHREMPDYLAAMDACVASLPSDPTLHYLSPMKTLEYLACGCPTVVAAAPTLAAVVEAQAALAYRPGDTADLASRLETIATDPALRERLAQRGRKFAEAQSWRAGGRAIAEAASTLTRIAG